MTDKDAMEKAAREGIMTLEQLADQWVCEVVPGIYEALEKAEIPYNDEMICHLLTDGFKAGWQAALSGPKVMALVDAARKYLNTAPVDGWHFEVCTMNEDEEMGCSCGTGPAEIKLQEALAEFEGEK